MVLLKEMVNGMEAKLIRVFSLIILLWACFSCERFFDEIRNREAIDKYISPYMGKWYGNYSGSENGTLTFNVGKTGTIECYRSNGDFIFGKVYDDGVLMSTMSLSTGFRLYGTLKANKGSGIWKLGNMNGTWSITK